MKIRDLLSPPIEYTILPSSFRIEPVSVRSPTVPFAKTTCPLDALEGSATVLAVLLLLVMKVVSPPKTTGPCTSRELPMLTVLPKDVALSNVFCLALTSSVVCELPMVVFPEFMVLMLTFCPYILTSPFLVTPPSVFSDELDKIIGRSTSPYI